MTSKTKTGNAFGDFSPDGKEYIIRKMDTPRPWINVISNRTHGLVISQTGGGYSWREDANLNRLTRWEQDLVRDNSGKYFYLRDNGSGKFRSLSWKPVKNPRVNYLCRHGLGYTTFSGAGEGLKTEYTVFVPREDPLEISIIRVKNTSSKRKNLSIFSYLEWLLGRWPDSHREFHRLFIKTSFDPVHRTQWAEKSLWELPNDEGEHWNRSWEYIAFHSVFPYVSGHSGDKESFIGRYRDLKDPVALENGVLDGREGPGNDSIGSLKVDFSLEPGRARTFVFLLGAAPDRKQALRLIKKYGSVPAARAELKKVRKTWDLTIGECRVETPAPYFDLMTNTWLKYQTIAARIRGRAAYYQSSGANGFRDQLQDSQIFLDWDPELTGEQIKLHARAQFQDGKVLHWWHPLTGEGLPTEMTDDLLWLPFVLLNYLKETGNYNLLDKKEPFLTRPGEKPRTETIYRHCCRAIEQALQRFSPRGLPLIGEGDWNDGLNSVGDRGRGESIWLGHFLYGVLMEFAGVCREKKDHRRSRRFRDQAEKLYQSLNRHGWDGKWYARATTDEGRTIGSAREKEGKIFLNAQTWAIINRTVPEKRKPLLLKALDTFLYHDYGPITFFPAYSTPQPDIGYLTRYSAGNRENGGNYTHAAVWAILAECAAGRPEKAFELYRQINPILRGKDPELYRCEPYVTPGNVDGPQSPHYGQGGWTWYTGSAAWLFRVSTHWILGIRPVPEGLLIDPQIPEDWPFFKILRKFRGDTYEITVRNPKGRYQGVKEIYLDGKPIPPPIINPVGDKKPHKVEVVLE